MYPLSKLRRIALEQQGLLRATPYGRGRAGTAKTIRQLGYVQIDTISVVERAHNHVLATRVPNFQPRHLDELQRRGEIFEYWYHAAAYLPMESSSFNFYAREIPLFSFLKHCQKFGTEVLDSRHIFTPVPRDICVQCFCK